MCLTVIKTQIWEIASCTSVFQRETGLRVWWCWAYGPTWWGFANQEWDFILRNPQNRNNPVQFYYDKSCVSVMFEYCLSVSLSGGESCSRSAGLRHGSGVSAACRLCCKQGQIHPKISRWGSRMFYDCLNTCFWGFFNHRVWRQSPYEHMNYMLFHFFLLDLMFSTMMM